MAILETILLMVLTAYIVMDCIQFRQIKEILELQEIRIFLLKRRIEHLEEKEMNVWKDKRLR